MLFLGYLINKKRCSKYQHPGVIVGMDLAVGASQYAAYQQSQNNAAEGNQQKSGTGTKGKTGMSKDGKRDQIRNNYIDYRSSIIQEDYHVVAGLTGDGGLLATGSFAIDLDGAFINNNSSTSLFLSASGRTALQKTAAEVEFWGTAELIVDGKAVSNQYFVKPKYEYLASDNYFGSVKFTLPKVANSVKVNFQFSFSFQTPAGGGNPVILNFTTDGLKGIMNRTLNIYP